LAAVVAPKNENILRGFRAGGVNHLFNTNDTTIINIQPIMKKTNRYLLPGVCALGVMAFATPLKAAESAMPSCCMGGLTTPLAADASTNQPDLLTTCPVSGDKLDGDMGKPYVFVYQGQEVKLCCKGCKKDFDKNPEKYLAKIRAADKK
jgi:YHS domain-containing protein